MFIKNSKKDIILYFFIIVSLCIAFGLGETPIDKFTSFFIILGTIGIMRIAVQKILESLTKDYHPVMAVCMFVAIIFAFAVQIINFTMPIVSTGIVELNYDLAAKEFVASNETKIIHKLGTYTISRIKEPKGNRYRIHTPHKILEVDMFSTSYDRDGQHLGIINWKNGSHFSIQQDYIESNHVLGETNNGGMGRHVLVYKYRENPLRFFSRPYKIVAGTIFAQ